VSWRCTDIESCTYREDLGRFGKIWEDFGKKSSHAFARILASADGRFDVGAFWIARLIARRVASVNMRNGVQSLGNTQE
jgi:hypothetical protein